MVRDGSGGHPGPGQHHGPAGAWRLPDPHHGAVSDTPSEFFRRSRGVGILTIVPDWTSDPSLQAPTLQAVLQDFLNSVATPPGGVAATAYFSVQEASPPSSYDAPGGGPPVEPSAVLTPQSGATCDSGTGTFFSMGAGKLQPTQVFLVVKSGQFSYGFTEGEFMIDWEGDGFNSAFWYEIPAVTVPSP